MKVDRSINFLSDLTEEDWRTIYVRHKLLKNSRYGINQYLGNSSNQNSGIVFCPYIPQMFDISSMYPHIIEVKEDETKIRCRTFKRYTPGP